MRKWAVNLGNDIEGAGLTFLLGFVCQHGSEGDVTDAPDVLLRGCELIIDNDAASVVQLDACSLEVQTINVRAAADSDEDDIRF